MKVLLRLLVLVVLAWVLIWLGLNSLARSALEQQLAQLQQKASANGYTLRARRLQDVSVPLWPDRVRVERLQLLFSRERLNPEPATRIDLGRVELRLSDWGKQYADLHVSGVEIALDKADAPGYLPLSKVSNGRLYVPDLPVLKPRIAVQKLIDRAQQLMRDNHTPHAVEFAADITIEADQGRTYSARLQTGISAEGYRQLLFAEQDVAAVANTLGLTLAPAQIAIIAHYPARLPLLMAQAWQARQHANNYFEDGSGLHDALRHLSWSYLVTAEFGPDFARELTDAQEDKQDNNRDQHLMDYHNNALARQLVAERVAYADLPEIARFDPRVIRNPDEVALRDPAELMR